MLEKADAVLVQDMGLVRALRRRTLHIYTCRSQSRRTDKHIFHFKSY